MGECGTNSAQIFIFPNPRWECDHTIFLEMPVVISYEDITTWYILKDYRIEYLDPHKNYNKKKNRRTNNFDSGVDQNNGESVIIVTPEYLEI